MSRSSCIKEWVNGNEISVSIDDNLCNKFRADVVVFHNDTLKNRTEVDSCRCLTHMCELIQKATKIANEKAGTIKPFNTRVLINGESLEEK